MALKTKGAKHAPKAGPKKRRAKSEAEAIRAAVEEHGLRKPAKRGSVRKYTYKAATAPKRKVALPSDEERLYGLRAPDGPSRFDLFKDELPQDAKPYARVYWTMQCEHLRQEDVAAVTHLEGAEPSHVRCLECGLMRSWEGTKTMTKLQEWLSYCPEGFDMFDWQDLYVRDRSLWRFIHDEVLAEMAETSITSEEAV